MPWDVWVRAVAGVVPLLRSWAKTHWKPEPVETVFVHEGHAYLEIENRGTTADFTVQIIKAVNVDKWPSTFVWARWDHDRHAQIVRMSRRTRALVHLASVADRKGLTWTCFWGSDYEMGQVRVARPTGPQWMAELHIQIVTEPECNGGAQVHIVFLKADGSVSWLARPTPYRAIAFEGHHGQVIASGKSG